MLREEQGGRIQRSCPKNPKLAVINPSPPQESAFISPQEGVKKKYFWAGFVLLEGGADGQIIKIFNYFLIFNFIFFICKIRVSFKINKSSLIQWKKKFLQHCQRPSLL